MELAIGSTVPVLFASDATHLTNFSGDGKVWPLYMSIGNIKSSTRNKSSNQAWVPVALLPVGPKSVKKVPGWPEEKQEQEAIQVLHSLLEVNLRPLSNKAHDGIQVKCADEVIRSCYFRVAAWLADHMENSTIHSTYSTRCPICECPVHMLGESALHPLRNHHQYAEWVQKSDKASLHKYGVKFINNALWTLRAVTSIELIRSDILHTILLGNLEHLMNWIIGFLEVNGRLYAFDDIWRMTPSYPGNRLPQKPYRQLTQIAGKEMRAILKIILAVFTASPRRNTDTTRPTATQQREFKNAIECVRYLTDFSLLSRYRSHRESTVQYMRDYLQRFHDTKDVFLRFRASKASKGKADIVSKELTAQNRKRDEQETKNERTAAQKARTLAADKQEHAFLVNEALVEDSHFNFPKIHLLSHWADQIPRFGCLPQYSTEICETSHKALKDIYRRSNHVDGIPQIIQGYSREHNFAVRQLEMEAWATQDESLHQRLKDVLGRPKRKTAQLMVPQGAKVHMTLGGKHSVKEVFNLCHLANEFMIPEIGLHTQVFFETNVFSMSEHWESDAKELLANAAVEAYTSLEVPVPDQDTDDINSYQLQMLRTTGKKYWRGQGARRDSVWVHLRKMDIPATSVSRRVFSYKGRIPAFLNALFTIRMGGELYKLAHVTIVEWVGNPIPHGPEGMSYVESRPMGEGEMVIGIRNIEGAVHLVPLEPDQKWIVNNRVDYHVWNEMNDGL